MCLPFISFHNFRLQLQYIENGHNKDGVLTALLRHVLKRVVDYDFTFLNFS